LRIHCSSVGDLRSIMDRWNNFATAFLSLGGVLCLIVVSFSVQRFTVMGPESFNPVTRIILPALTALVFFGALQLRREYRLNIVISVVSLIGALYAAEAFLALRLVSVPQTAWWGVNERNRQEVLALAQRFGMKFDTRSRLQVLKDLIQKDIDAVPVISPSEILKRNPDSTVKSAIRINDTEVVPLAGISNRVTVFCNESGEYTVYNSDRRGFHNPDQVWRSDGVDIAALGDSFVLGGCVESQENFVSLIGKRYPATVNLGMAGDGPLSMLGTMREYLSVLKPKVVLWFYFEEAAFSFLEAESDSLLRHYMERSFSQNLNVRQPEIDKALLHYVREQAAAEVARQKAAQNRDTISSRIRSFLDFSARLGTLRRYLGLVDGGMREGNKNILPLFQRIITEANDSARELEAKLYFVYLPQWERYGNPKLAFQKRDAVLDVVTSLDIPIIDLHPVFQAHDDPLSLFPLRRMGHYTKEGHRLTAELVLRSLSPQTQLSAH
jgi:hypothetical protein